MYTCIVCMYEQRDLCVLIYIYREGGPVYLLYIYIYLYKHTTLYIYTAVHIYIYIHLYAGSIWLICPLYSPIAEHTYSNYKCTDVYIYIYIYGTPWCLNRFNVIYTHEIVFKPPAPECPDTRNVQNPIQLMRLIPNQGTPNMH